MSKDILQGKRKPGHGQLYSDAHYMIATGDSWKELASVISKQSNKASMGDTVRRLITRLNERSPFAKASGILDNGCGGGAIISLILDDYGAEIPPTASIVAGDFSEHMLKVVQDTKDAKVAEGKAGWERLEVRNLDAQDMVGIADGSLSHVTGGHLYFLLPDYRKALKETYRVLGAGGELAISGGRGSQHLDALHDAVEVVRPGTNLQMIQEPWASEAGVKSELEAAGFGDVETFVVDSVMKYERHNDFAKMLLTMPVMKNVIGDYTEDEKDRLLAELVVALRSRNAAEPGELSGSSIVALGRKS